jgi:hypothetical protein
MIWKDGAWTVGAARRLDPPPPPYFGSYRQLAAVRSNPLPHAIIWQLMANCGLPSPSLMFADLCQLFSTLSPPPNPPSLHLRHLLLAPGSSRQSLSFPSCIPLSCISFLEMANTNVSAGSCLKLPVYGRNKGREDDAVSYLPRGAESWQKWVDRRAAVSCRELLGNGRNGEVRGAAVSCHKVP